jgi:hypothetical protein
MFLGLANAPSFFERITAVVKPVIRRWGVRLLSYIDDFVTALGLAMASALTLRETVFSALCAAGWVLACSKTTMPSCALDVLGFHIDSVIRIVRPSDSRLAKLKTLGAELLKLGQNALVNAKTVARMAGYLVSMEAGCVYAQRLSYPFLACLKTVHKYQEWYKSVPLTPEAVTALQIVCNHDSWLSWACGKPFDGYVADRWVATDSSTLASGGSIIDAPKSWTDFLALRLLDVPKARTVSRLWRDRKLLHINVKELLAFIDVLDTFASELQGLRIGAVVDNTVAASYIRKGGGAVKILNDNAWRLTLWLVRHRVVLAEVRRAKSAENLIADACRY